MLALIGLGYAVAGALTQWRSYSQAEDIKAFLRFGSTFGPIRTRALIAAAFPAVWFYLIRKAIKTVKS